MEDLIKLYLNSGRALTEYQLNKLNINQLKTYYQRRKLAVTFVEWQDYEKSKLRDLILDDVEYQKTIINQDPDNFEFIIEELYEEGNIPYDIQMTAIKKDGNYIDYLKHFFPEGEVPYEMQLAAVQSKGDAIRYVKLLYKKNELPQELMRAAITNDVEAILRIDNPPKEIKKFAEKMILKQFGRIPGLYAKFIY